MSVEVDTPDGLRVGTSVYEVVAWYEPGFDPSGRVRREQITGEALAVDLPGGQRMFALLRTLNPERDSLATISMAALDPAYRHDWVESVRRISNEEGVRSPALLMPENFPMLVTFADETDSQSVRVVDAENLEASFGTGVRLRRIIIEKTDANVTTGIEERLPWLRRSVDGGLDPTKGVSATRTLAQKLGFLDFRRH